MVVLRRIICAREEMFYEQPPWEPPRLPLPTTRLPSCEALTPISRREAMYMATTLQRAMNDARIGLGGWEVVRRLQQPRLETVRAIWCTSRNPWRRCCFSCKARKSLWRAGCGSGLTTWKTIPIQLKRSRTSTKKWLGGAHNHPGHQRACGSPYTLMPIAEENGVKHLARIWRNWHRCQPDSAQ